MRSRFPFIFIVILLVGCETPSVEKAKEITFELQDIPLKEKMKKAMDDHYLANLGLDESERQYIQEFYANNDYKTYWINDSILNAKGEQNKSLLENSIQIALPQNRIAKVSSFNYIQDEIATTLKLACAINDLKNGFIDYEEKIYKPRVPVEKEKLDSLFQFDDTTDLRLQYLRYGPADSTYEVLGKGLIYFLDKYPLDTTTFDIVSIKYDSLETLPKTRKALISKGYTTDTLQENDSIGITEILKVFQMDNGLKPDGKVGKFTSKELNESTKRKLQRVMLAMDKHRQEREYPEKYIRINIPEYKLRFVADDTLRREHNIVVGTYENQTPELESKLRMIVVYPYWNVPYSIASKEILPAVKWNIGYLAKHNYKVYRDTTEIDPYKVNWKSIRQNALPYKFIQQPGTKNSLGILKFDFYNPYSVYFHDTPAKGLFGADVRSYSHGCMRTQNPVELAKEVLHYDSISPRRFNHLRPDSLDSLLNLEENFEIRLKDRFPIYVDYVSVVREGEEMVIYHDVYGRDEEYIKLMNEGE